MNMYMHLLCKNKRTVVQKHAKRSHAGSQACRQVLYSVNDARFYVLPANCIQAHQPPVTSVPPWFVELAKSPPVRLVATPTFASSLPIHANAPGHPDDVTI